MSGPQICSLLSPGGVSRPLLMTLHWSGTGYHLCSCTLLAIFQCQIQAWDEIFLLLCYASLCLRSSSQAWNLTERHFHAMPVCLMEPTADVIPLHHIWQNSWLISRLCCAFEISLHTSEVRCYGKGRCSSPVSYWAGKLRGLSTVALRSLRATGITYHQMGLGEEKRCFWPHATFRRHSASKVQLDVGGIAEFWRSSSTKMCEPLVLTTFK